MKWFFDKNYPLWVIIILFGIILYLCFLLYNPYVKINKVLENKNIVILNGKPVTCTEFKIVPEFK